MKHVSRGGEQYRVCDPSWRDPLDTTYAKQRGGRWNPRGAFGALYLNATIAVAAANARNNFTGEIATLYDLLPEQRPQLQIVEVASSQFVDAVTDEGIQSLHLPKAYPHGAGWQPCQRVGQEAYAADEPGIACRSHADATARSFVGEELAVFDTALEKVTRGARVPFEKWYPTEVDHPPDRSHS